MSKQLFFAETLHNETKPTGYLGRGTHYSVFRCLAFRDHLMQPTPMAFAHDFAVIWDEDHDRRVFEAIYRIYVAGLLSPALFVGERKGGFTMIVSDSFPEQNRRLLDEQIHEICQGLPNDPWQGSVHTVSAPEGMIINDSDDKVSLYLQALKMLWKLGLKDPIFEEEKNPGEMDVEWETDDEN